MSLTTWAEIRQGDTIRALDGSLWHVEWRIESRVGGPGRPVKIEAGIHDGTTRTEVTYPATDPVERVEQTPQVIDWTLDPSTRVTGALIGDQYVSLNSDPELDTATDLITQADIDVEVIAEETTEERMGRELASREEPLVLPVIVSKQKLYSHFYLLHSRDLPKPQEGREILDVLVEAHQHAHTDGPMSAPHLHRGDET